MSKWTEAQFPGNHGREALQRYYDAIAGSRGRFVFLTPLRLPYWFDDAAKWIGGGETVAELGVGLGELVAHAVSLSNQLKSFLAIDLSPGMLASARHLVEAVSDSAPVQFVQADVAGADLVTILGVDRLDKVIAVNVLQDVHAGQVLQNVYRVLKPGGLFRATVIRRETQDEFWIGDDGYDATRGRMYTFSRMHDLMDQEPLGVLERPDGEKAFYRIQQFYSKHEITSLLEEAGFSVLSVSVIEFPIDLVMQRWSSEFHRVVLDRRQESLLAQWGCFPDSYDVVACKPTG